MRSPLHQRLVLATAALACALGLTGCGAGGVSGKALAPATAMKQAESHLDTTSGVKVALSTADNPSGDSVLTSAQGVVTDTPAFEGTASGKYKGVPVSDIAVVSVGGVFQAKLPFSGYAELDPGDLCAPDPAGLLDPATGISSVLAAATGLKAGSATRGGTDNKDVLTPYSGAVAGSAMSKILPCAKAASYQVRFTVDDGGYLRSADLTGDFFGDGTTITYTLQISAYGVTQDIEAPKP